MAGRGDGAGAAGVRSAADLGRRRVLETLDAIAENPRRLGKRLMLEHEGRFSTRRGPYRIIYEVDGPASRSCRRDRSPPRRLPSPLIQRSSSNTPLW